MDLPRELKTPVRTLRSISPSGTSGAGGDSHTAGLAIALDLDRRVSTDQRSPHDCEQVGPIHDWPFGHGEQDVAGANGVIGWRGCDAQAFELWAQGSSSMSGSGRHLTVMTAA